MEQELKNGKKLKKGRAPKMRKASKLLKKSFKILLVVLILTVYFNIGYYYGASHYNANVKYYAGAKLNTFENFQLGAWKCFVGNSERIAKNSSSDWAIGFSILLWPLAVLGSMVTWIAYGLVYLFKLIFLGGFFRLVYQLIT